MDEPLDLRINTDDVPLDLSVKKCSSVGTISTSSSSIGNTSFCYYSICL